MANDPITGLDLDKDRTQEVLDYLGRKSPIGISQQSALPGVQGASPGTGPASPGGSGQAQDTSQGQHFSPFGQNPAQQAGSSIGNIIGPPLISAAGGGLKDFAKGLLTPNQGLHGAAYISPYGDTGASPIPTGPENTQLLSGFEPGAEEAGFASGVVEDIGSEGASVLGELAPALADFATPYGAFSGAYGLAKLGFGLGLHTQTGPSTGNPWEDAAIGLLGPGLSEGVTGLVSRLAGPSSAWRNFGSHLGQRLGGESSAVQTLIPWLQKAKTQGDVTQAAEFFRQLVEKGAGVGGYQAGQALPTGAPQIGTLPGAGGTPHEGRILADFGPATKAINEYLGKLYAALPPGPESQPLTYESYAAGWSQPQYEQFMNLAQQGMGLTTLQDQQAFVAQSGLDPAMQEKLLSYIGNQLVNPNAYMLQQSADPWAAVSQPGA